MYYLYTVPHINIGYIHHIHETHFSIFYPREAPTTMKQQLLLLSLVVILSYLGFIQAALPKCKKRVCTRFQKCLVESITGEEYCADFCDKRRCPSNQKCVLTPVNCFRSPCPPKAFCEPLN
jgi:hypothetical protein